MLPPWHVYECSYDAHWKHTLGEAMQQAAELEYCVVDCSESPVQDCCPAVSVQVAQTTCCASPSAGGCARFLIMTGFALLGLAAVGNFLDPIGLGPIDFALPSLAEGSAPISASEGAC